MKRLIDKETYKILKESSKNLTKPNLLTEATKAQIQKAIEKTSMVIDEFFEEWSRRRGIGTTWLHTPCNNPNMPLFTGDDTVLQYIEKNFRNTAYHSGNVPASFLSTEPMFMKIALRDCKYEQADCDYAKMNRLWDFIAYLRDHWKEIMENKESKKDFQNMMESDTYSLDVLEQKFGQILNDIQAEDDRNANSITSDSDSVGLYEVKRIFKYSEAKPYAKYTGYLKQNPETGEWERKGEMCFCETMNAWEQYSQGGDSHGTNMCYLLLRNDWEKFNNVAPIPEGENCPKDDYGTSLIFVFINPSRNISSSHTRWNHFLGNNGAGVTNIDRVFSKTELAQLLGKNFNEVFKTKEEVLNENHNEVTESFKRDLNKISKRYF